MVKNVLTFGVTVLFLCNTGDAWHHHWNNSFKLYPCNTPARIFLWKIQKWKAKATLKRKKHHHPEPTSRSLKDMPKCWQSSHQTWRCLNASQVCTFASKAPCDWRKPEWRERNLFPCAPPQVFVIPQKSLPGIQAGYGRTSAIFSSPGDPTWPHRLVLSSPSTLVLAVSLLVFSSLVFSSSFICHREGLEETWEKR